MRLGLLSLFLVILPIAAAKAEPRDVKISFDTPGSGYQVRIVEAYRVGDELWVVSQIEPPPRGSFGLTVITPVSDQAKIDADEELKVRHKVVGKSWNWGEETETIEWVKDFKTLDAMLEKEMPKTLWQKGGAEASAQRREASADESRRPRQPVSPPKPEQ